jgi:transcriptional regulator GlxA family with amidase domain
VRHGNEIASKIAKSLVVYKRREASDSQESIYIQNRNHHDERIHKVQDWIIQNLDKASTIEELADLVFVSPRNLTRLFKKETGISISDYRTKLKVEKAVSLLKNSELKIEQIAYSCGYKTSKQLRIILEKQFKSLPSEIRERLS